MRGVSDVEGGIKNQRERSLGASDSENGIRHRSGRSLAADGVCTLARCSPRLLLRHPTSSSTGDIVQTARTFFTTLV